MPAALRSMLSVPVPQHGDEFEAGQAEKTPSRTGVRADVDGTFARPMRRDQLLLVVGAPLRENGDVAAFFRRH